MATEFQDNQHYAMFKGAGAYRTGNAFDVRWSEITLAALRAAGVLDNMVDGTVPPADTDLLWLDKNHDPAQLKVWDSTGLTWVLATFAKLFDRNVHTLKVTPLVRLSGSENLISVAEPASFFDGLLYSVTPVKSNTGNTFITVQGVGTYPVMYANDQHIQPNEMRADAVKVLLYYGSKFYVLFPTADAFNAMIAAQAAADEAESYRDQAAAIVNDIASEKEVPIVGVVEALPSLDLPAGMTAIRTNGFSTMGDGGAWPLAVEVPNTGDLKAWHRLTNGGTRRWELRTNIANIKMFGAKGDGGTDDTWAAQYGDNYVASRGGGVLLYPPGDFVFSKIQASGSNPNVAVLLSDKVKHVGAGVASTKITLAPAAFASLFFGRALKDAAVCNMTIDGTRADQASPVFDGKDPCGILIGDSAERVSLFNLKIINTVDYGIGIQVAYMKDCVIHDVEMDNVGADGFDNKNTGVASTNNRMWNMTINSFGMQGETGETFAALNFRGDWNVDNVRINNLGLGIGATAGRDAIRFDNSGSTDPATGGGAKSSVSRVYVSGYGTDYQNVARVQGVVMRDRDIRLSDFYIENVGRGVVRGQKNTHVSNGTIMACRRGIVEDSTLTHAGNPLPTLPVYGTVRDVVIKDCLEIGLRLEGNVEGNTYEGLIVDNCGVNISMAGTAKKNRFIGGASINAATPYTGGDGSNKFIGVDGIVGLTKTMSADVDVASVGTKTVTVSHGLTAGAGAISASLQEYSVTAVGDYRAQARVSAITSTQVTLEVLVSVASATAGAKNRYEVTASKNQ
ncbi:glycosyl hydrolase family 28-related protein [Agrobacterium pusense]|uniref:glycosyl hydrolase family 28-related protein n=1 Tax=Agrobacterium pusense TaxID=648995 RepID=UPI000D19E58F|nr:glycosyl hydrolase family 28-related protein [Agrobacterium pusense]